MLSPGTLLIAQEPEAPRNRFADFFSNIFDTNDFPARWECGNWPAELGWLHICSDVAIFVAYAAIPISLMFFIARRRDIALRAILWLFVAFILFCGLTHLTDAVMFYFPAYRFLGLMKFGTATVSLATVVALVRVMPKAVALPGIAEAHKLAELEIERRKTVEKDLLRTRDELEKRSAALTSRGHKIQRALLGIHAAGVSWNVSTNDILWETGLAEQLNRPDGILPSITSWSQLLGEPELKRLRREAEAAIAGSKMLYIKMPVVLTDGTVGTYVLRAVTERSDPLKGSMTGLVALVRGVED